MKKTLEKRVPEMVIFLVAILQALFAMVEFRYENYLMISFLLLLVPVISEYFSKKEYLKNFRKIIIGISIFGIFLISGYRFYYFTYPLKVASKNISEQQVEISRFLNKNYQNEKVVANDIGAISYYGNVQLLDIVGLGSTEVAREVLKHKNNAKDEFDNKMYIFLKNYIPKNNYKIAIIYPEWFPKEIPKEWTAVASWTNTSSRITARKRVFFML